ncbi:hypothetical protein [Stenotrophomonas humi]
MKNYALLASMIIAAGLVGCDKIAPPTENAGIPEKVDAPATVAKEGAAATADSGVALPWGIKPGVEFSLRSRASENGVDRLVVTYSELEAKVLDGKIETALKEKGFNRYGNFARGAELVGDYGMIKDGKSVARVTVTVIPEGQGATTGIVYFKWQ